MMKKVLIASLALIATTGMALADSPMTKSSHASGAKAAHAASVQGKKTKLGKTRSNPENPPGSSLPQADQ